MIDDPGAPEPPRPAHASRGSGAQSTKTEAAFDPPQEELGLAFLPALLKPLLCPLLHGLTLPVHYIFPSIDYLTYVGSIVYDTPSRLSREGGG
jgi:hypothetical protein